ncbi:MAG: hypothetical protein ACI4EE_12935 [Lachnospiraceae bacterium]
MSTDEHKKKRSFKIFKSRKFGAICIVAAYIIINLIISILYHHFNNTLNCMETLYYATQIISSIFVVGGVVVAVWQYCLCCQDTRTNLEIVQVQRAIDLSEYYKDNILRYLPAIYYIFDNSGASDILHTIRPDQMKHFDKQELQKLLSVEQIATLQNLTTKPEFFRLVIEANDIFNLNLKFKEKFEIKEDSEKREVVVHVNVQSIIVSFLSQLINQTLNNMEYFALHFSHNTADESVVYQSLHKSYLEAIGYLYYYISNQNDDPADKLYTNVTALYFQWKDAQEQQDIERLEKNNTLQRHGTIVRSNR